MTFNEIVNKLAFIPHSEFEIKRNNDEVFIRIVTDETLVLPGFIIDKVNNVYTIRGKIDG